jgi:hypothetical protein
MDSEYPCCLCFIALRLAKRGFHHLRFNLPDNPPLPVVGELLKITRRWASDRVRDSAAATGTKQSLMASVLRQVLAAVLSSPSERDVR